MTNKLDSKTFGFIEKQIYKYPELKREVWQMRETIVAGKPKHDENVGGGRSNVPGRPTEQVAIKLASYKPLFFKSLWVDAIGSAFSMIPDEYKGVIQLKYWDKRQMKIEGIAIECHMHRNTVSKYRRKFVYLVAEEVGILTPKI